ncbi:MAG: glycerophosphodiester phosphodiesterase [Acutalibacteraceae bacterium]
MKKIIAPIMTAVSVAGLSAGLLTNYIANKSEYLKPKDGIEITKDLKMIAHRGLSSCAPENSLSAYRLAGEAGFKYAECDIRMTKDNEWVLTHDAKLNRVTDGKGLVSEKTLEEIKALRYKRGANIKLYKDEKIATIREFLQVCTEYGISPFIEIKSGNEIGFADLIDMLKEFKMFKKAIIIDYNVNNLKAIRQLCPELQMMILCKVVSRKVIAMAEEIGNCGIDVMHTLMMRNKALADVAEKGLSLNCWTVDRIGTLKKAHKLGAAYVTTNCVKPLQKQE